MSLEQAILKLAEAVTAQADAIKDSAAAQRESNQGYKASLVAYAQGVAAQVVGAPVVQTANEKAAEKKTAEVKPDAELEKAVSQVEEAAAEEVDDGLTDEKELDYATDVRPVLMQLNKAKGKEPLAALLKKYGAATGDKIKPVDFAKIVADANAQLAA